MSEGTIQFLIEETRTQGSEALIQQRSLMACIQFEALRRRREALNRRLGGQRADVLEHLPVLALVRELQGANFERGVRRQRRGGVQPKFDVQPTNGLPCDEPSRSPRLVIGLEKLGWLKPDSIPTGDVDGISIGGGLAK